MNLAFATRCSDASGNGGRPQSQEKAKHVLGAHGSARAEYMESEAKVEYRVFARTSALAEMMWTPGKKELERLYPTNAKAVQTVWLPEDQLCKDTTRLWAGEKTMAVLSFVKSNRHVQKIFVLLVSFWWAA